MKGSSYMRNAIGAFGLAAGAIAVALVARYGYVAGVTPLDRITTALVFSIIAIVGLAGPAIALRLTRSSLGLPKLWGALAGILAAAALLANLSNSLAAIENHAEHTRVADGRQRDEAELERVKAERDALHFTPTTMAAVADAREALLTADTARRAECDIRRTKFCEEYAANVATKRDAFAALFKDRAKTEIAEKLDAEAAGIHARLDEIPPEPDAKSQPAAFSFSFKLPDRDSVTLLHVAVAGTVELLSVFSLIGWVLLGAKPRTTEVIRQVIRNVPVESTKREPASSSDLAMFVQDCMRPAGGETVELQTLYLRFLEWCNEQKLSPLPPKRFSEAFITRCEEAQIDVRCDGSRVLCLDVKLAPAHLLH
jgi:hypothetical protein